MDPIDIAIYTAIPVCTGVVGYAIAAMKTEGLRKRNDALRSLLEAQKRVTRNALNDAVTIGAERDALLAQAERARAKLSEAGRAGAIKSNAARAERLRGGGASSGVRLEKRAIRRVLRHYLLLAQPGTPTP